MIFRFPGLKRWLLVCAASGIVLPALAQRHGQPIIFSEPDAETPATNSTPSLTPTAPQFQYLIEDRTPLTVAAPPAQWSPTPVPVMTPAQAAAAQEQLDRQKNWILLTPAEILGVPTMENTFGRDALGDKKNQTVLERYFERLQRNEMQAATNASANWSLQGQEQKDSKPDFSAPQNSFFGAPQNNRADQMNDTAWTKDFNSSSTATTPQTPQQLEAARMAAQTEADDFQKLLQPGLAATSVKTVASPVLPQTTPNSFFAPAPNSIGASFTPISSSVIAPQGVAPLPWESTGKNPSTTPVTPEWKRKLPPWMSEPSLNRNF